jgi:D-beta-D-heptose 7-phosphate kinase/D-beta-D-heptose 1-phosphate adenosyltransferase
VIACGRTGLDREGQELRDRLTSETTDISGLIVEANYQTPVKNRLIADSQQLLRVDFEKITPLQTSYEDQAIAFLEKTIPAVQVVAVSDYGKGFLTTALLSAAIRISRASNVPLIIDPKGIDFTKYRGAHVLKPNLSEAYAAAKRPASTPLEEVAAELLAQTGVGLLLITRSEAGISLFNRKGERTDFSVRSKEVKDVTGAGDTVLSLICLGLANGLEIEVAVQLANIAAGLSIERLGCVQVTLSEIARRLLEFDSDTKIYDESHTYALKQVLKGKKYTLLVLNGAEALSPLLFQTIRKLSKPKEADLLIYVRGSRPSDELIQLLSSLHEVNFIILQTESLKDLCDAIHPFEIYSLENERLQQVNQAIELITSLLEPRIIV